MVPQWRAQAVSRSARSARAGCQFLDRYERDLADAYDAGPDGGLLLLYPRLFMYARKGKPKP